MSRTVVDQLNANSFASKDPLGFAVRRFTVSESTNGNYDSAVIRASPDVRLPTDWMGKDDTLFIGFVLNGWLDIEFESIGRQHMQLQGVVESQNGERRRLLACSDDLELFVLTSKTLKIKQPKSAMVQHMGDEPYRCVDEGGYGQRDHIVYRNLGIATATGGVIGANLPKVIKPARKNDDQDYVRKPHIHILDLHVNYQVRGWGDFYFQDIGTHRLNTSTMLYLPPSMPHGEIDRVVGLEGLEITAPAVYRTEIVEDYAGKYASAHA